MTEKIDFHHKVILAPMVRVSTLPFRLLSLKYGADLVYCEEIIDFKILSSTRVENDILGTVDYVMSDGFVVFRTCAQEKGKVFFQLGTSDPERAVAAALKVQDDVAGIDVNMGCPKEFSIKGGMGAALLKKPEKVKQILSSLVKAVSIPVTCKIRCLPTLDETIELAKIIEKTGVSALTVHGRTKEERPRHTNRNEFIRKIAESLSIPVIANGGSKEMKDNPDIQKFAKNTGCTSVMVAQAAERNPSIFSKEGMIPLLDIVREYIKMAIDWDNNAINSKYCILAMMYKDMDLKEGDQSLTAVTMEEFSEIWGLQEYFNQHKQSMTKLLAMKYDKETEIHVVTTDDGHTTIEMPFKFIKKEFPPKISPKQRLYEATKRAGINRLEYDVTERTEDRCYNCILNVGGNLYTTPYWEKSKQLAEQGTAMVATTVLDIEDERQFVEGGQNEALVEKWKKRKNDSDVKDIYLSFKHLLDKANEEKEKLAKKRLNDETNDSCIEVKHFVSDNHDDVVT